MSPERELVESILELLYKFGMHPNQSFVFLVTKKVFLMNTASRITLFFLTFYMIGTNLDDVNIIMDGLETTVAFCEVTFNLVPLLVYKHRLQEILVDLDKFWPGENLNWDHLKKYLRCYRGVFWFIYSMLLVGSIYEGKLILKFYIPDFYYAKLVLEILLYLHVSFDYAVVTVMDCHLYASCYILEKQFYLMQEKLAAIIKEEDLTAMQSELSKWTIHHDVLLRYTSSLAEIFEIKFFLKYLVYICLFCAEIFAFDNTANARNSIETVMKVLQMGLQFTLLCVLSARVSDAAEMVSHAAYSLEWYNWPVKLRKDLILIIQRAQKVPKFTALGIIPIDHSTLTSVFQKSYSFYTIAKNVLRSNEH